MFFLSFQKTGDENFFACHYFYNLTGLLQADDKKRRFGNKKNTKYYDRPLYAIGLGAKHKYL